MNFINLLKTTRQHFWSNNFEEVEVSYFNKSLPLESNLYAYQIKDWYLPMSPEFVLKKYLAQNSQNCFSIAHCFRDLEANSPQHLSEFLMLEYYLVNQDLSSLQESLKKFLSHFGNWQFVNLELPQILPSNEPDFNQFFLNEIEPNLPKDKAVFVTGYPSFLSPLAVPNKRFELYINGIEIANGCEENRNAEQIKLAFETEQNYRKLNNLPTHPISQDFIDNCSLIPPCSGVGLGLDRLLLVINQTKEL